MKNIRIRCPKCNWEPDESCRWVCDVCGTKWNTFETHGECPGCSKIFVDTLCLRSRGGCGQISLHADWYKLASQSPPKNQTFTWFWQKKDELPITNADRVWLEANLIELMKIIGEDAFRPKHTITPVNERLQFDFSGSEENAATIMRSVANIMGIENTDIRLMFFLQRPVDFGNGITMDPSLTLDSSWNPREADLIKNESGEYEIWTNLEHLNDFTGLIATFSVQLFKYLLVDKYQISKKIRIYADLGSLVCGFGIFRSNAYFRFSQWDDTIGTGWRMSKKGGISEQAMAYAMAWLAHYRDEDISWKHFLNKTMKKYFERSYEYIAQNKDKIKWSLDS